jgi:hypothetical protein
MESIQEKSISRRFFSDICIKCEFMEAITVHPKNKEQLNALEIIFKAMKIPFEKAKINGHSASKKAETESPYDPEFVAKIRRSEKAVKAGKTYKIPLDEIWK